MAPIVQSFSWVLYNWDYVRLTRTANPMIMAGLAQDLRGPVVLLEIVMSFQDFTAKRALVSAHETCHYKTLDLCDRLKESLFSFCRGNTVVRDALVSKILSFSTDGAADEQLLPRLAKEQHTLPSLRVVNRCKAHAGSCVIKSPCIADDVYRHLLENLVFGFSAFWMFR